MRFIDEYFSFLQHEPYSAIFISQSREDDDDVRHIGKHDFRSVLLHAMLSNANRLTSTLGDNRWLSLDVIAAMLVHKTKEKKVF